MANSNDAVLNLGNLPRRAGFMYKKGGTLKGQGGRRNWKKRWFEFHATEYREREAYELRYYDTQGGTLKGTVPLFDVTIYCEPKSTHRRVKFEFQILLQNGGIFQLSCDTENEREEWIASINTVISYQKKLLLTSGYSLSGYDPLYDDEEECYNRGEAISQLCKAVGPGLVGSEAGHKTHFLVQVNDIDGEPTQEGGMPITATISDDQHLFYIKMIDNQDGTYGGYYCLGRPGVYDLHIKLNDEHDIDGSPFQIEILPSKTSPENSIAVGENIESCYPGVASSFVIYAKDIYGNNKQKGGDPFEVSIVGPAVLQSLTDNMDGSYTCCFEAKNPQELSYFAPSSLLLSVTLYGKHISSSPFHPIILSHPDPVDISVDASPRSEEEHALAIDELNSDFQKVEIAEDSNLVESSVTPPPEPSMLEEETKPQSKSPPRLTAKKRNSILTKQIAKIEESSGAPLSRLERARQRALMAKKLSDQQKLQPRNYYDDIETEAKTSKPFSETNSADATNRGTRRASVMRTDIDPITGLSLPAKNLPLSSSAPISSNTNRLAGDRSEINSNTIDISRSTDAELSKILNPKPSVSIDAMNSSSSMRRSSVQRVDIDPITGLPRNLKKLASQVPTRQTSENKSSNTSRMPSFASDSNDLGHAAPLSSSRSVTSKPPAGQSLRNSSSVFSENDMSSIQFGLSNGLVGSSAGLGEEDKLMWEGTHQAFQSAEVIDMLMNDIDSLKSSFDLMSGLVEGVQVLKLTNNSNTSGAFRLLEEFDVVPSYVTMREVKKAFALILTAQRNARVPSSIAGGGTGIDFIHFIKFLVMLVIFGLSKTTAFSALYKTSSAKVDVMLHKWGFADRVKYQLVKTSIASR